MSRGSRRGETAVNEDKFNKLAVAACAPVFIEPVALRMRPVDGGYLICKICT